MKKFKNKKHFYTNQTSTPLKKLLIKIKIIKVTLQKIWIRQILLRICCWVRISYQGKDL
jgi:hypothetical protein